MSPASIQLQETLQFLKRALPPAPCRVLEVGAGNGAVAIALAAIGYDVTALDESNEQPTQAGAEGVRWVEADFLHWQPDEPYSAVLFTRSLHHMASAESAFARSAEALEDGGLLIGEEFAYDRVTLPTARWYYDLEAVLVDTGILAPSGHEVAEGNPLGRWRKDHAHDPPLLTGHAMLAAARERFEITSAEEAPCLYRYFCERLEESERGMRVARRIFEVESRLLRERDITAAGLRIVGKKIA
ncbi:MAG: class I SAM-dependent methyltransferase [Candidatus Eiseniibacteriota bacterium]